MHGVGLMEFGAPDVVSTVELPQPTADPGEVVVRVVAATVNPSDTLMRAGQYAAGMTDLTPPYVTGMEFAGYVHEVGDDSSSLTVGQPVMGVVNPRRPAGGAHVEYIGVPSASVVPLPDSVDLVEAATVPMNGLAARMALDTLELQSGDTLLITGAAGAVGSYAIGMAKRAGLKVIANDLESNVDLLRDLGADEVAPPGEAMEAAVRQHCPDGVDGAIDAARLGAAAAALVRDGGAIVSLRRGEATDDPRLHQRYILVTDEMENPTALAGLGELFAEGILAPRVAVRLPISEAAEAHRLVEKGGLPGRVVLIFDGASEQ